MRKVRILEIGDMQNGFLQKTGNLYVHDAETIIAPANRFIKHVSNNFYDVVLVIMDTHFSEEYSHTEESRTFPIHCEYGTPDWELAVDIAGLSPVYYVMKNNFNVWNGNQPGTVFFSDPARKKAYDTLFHVLDDPHHPQSVMPLEDFIRSISPDHDTANLDVTLIGVASDYCNRYALDGWLFRGASVTILHDLTKGIKKETCQVLEEDQYHRYDHTRLRTLDSNRFLEYRG